MPKRKRESDYEHLTRKLRRLERKVRRAKRRDLDQRSDHTSDNSCSDSGHLEPFDEYQEDLGEPLVSTEELNQSTKITENVSDDVVVLSDPSNNSNVNRNEPSTSALVAPGNDIVADQAINKESSAQCVELDDVIKELLGEDPTESKTYGPEIHKELAVRFEHICKNGLTKEVRKELKEKYLVPDNCKLIDAPELNAEIKAALSEILAKRDKAIEVKQKQLAIGISCLGQALTKLLAFKDRDADLVKLLLDASKVLCDSQHNDTSTRRSFILSALKKEMKDQLQNTKVDKTLFGENLADTLKPAKAINKSGAELKATTAHKQQPANKKVSATTSRPKNWKGSFQNHKQPDHQKTKEQPSTRTRQSTSSRPSQQRQPQQRQNRNRN